MKPRTAPASTLGAAVALLLTSFFLWMPAASAEGIGAVIVTIDGDRNLADGRLMPETGRAVLLVNVDVTVNAAGACLESIQLSYRVLGAPAYASIVFNPSSTSIQVGGEGEGGLPPPPVTAASETYAAPPVEMIVSTTRVAPAFDDAKYEIEVKAAAGKVTGSSDGGNHACNVGEALGTGAATIKNDYLPVTVLNPAILYMKAGQNKKVLLPVEIANFGNGPTRITMEASQPNKEKLEAANVGAEVRLESRAQRGPSALYKAMRNIEVQTPHDNGYTNSIYVLQVKFSSSFDGTAAGRLQTDEQVLLFSVQVQGVYAPGVDPMLLIGVLAAGLVVRRRRMGGA